MHDISSELLRKEINDHLIGDRSANSHFSSWAADLQITMDYAGSGLSAYIGILDTWNRHNDNLVMHFHALWEVGFSNWDLIEEYLVYGQVQGGSDHTLAWSFLGRFIFLTYVSTYGPSYHH